VTTLVATGIVVAIVAAAILIGLLLDGWIGDRREQQRAAQRQAVLLLSQQRMRAVTRATLEAMRDASRSGLPNHHQKWGEW
jgi:type II secretory pathway pseudopilin PulG